MQNLMGKIQHLMTDFELRLAKRKKKLNDSVQLHRLIESVSTMYVYMYDCMKLCVSMLIMCIWLCVGPVRGKRKDSGPSKHPHKH